MSLEGVPLPFPWKLEAPQHSCGLPDAPLLSGTAPFSSSIHRGPGRFGGGAQDALYSNE